MSAPELRLFYNLAGERSYTAWRSRGINAAIIEVCTHIIGIQVELIALRG